MNGVIVNTDVSKDAGLIERLVIINNNNLLVLSYKINLNSSLIK